MRILRRLGVGAALTATLATATIVVGTGPAASLSTQPLTCIDLVGADSAVNCMAIGDALLTTTPFVTGGADVPADYQRALLAAELADGYLPPGGTTPITCRLDVSCDLLPVARAALVQQLGTPQPAARLTCGSGPLRATCESYNALYDLSRSASSATALVRALMHVDGMRSLAEPPPTSQRMAVVSIRHLLEPLETCTVEICPIVLRLASRLDTYLVACSTEIARRLADCATDARVLASETATDALALVDEYCTATCFAVLDLVESAAEVVSGCANGIGAEFGAPVELAGTDTLNCAGQVREARGLLTRVTTFVDECSSGENATCDLVADTVRAAGDLILGCVHGAAGELGVEDSPLLPPDSLDCASVVRAAMVLVDNAIHLAVECATGAEPLCATVIDVVTDAVDLAVTNLRGCVSGAAAALNQPSLGMGGTDPGCHTAVTLVVAAVDTARALVEGCLNGTGTLGGTCSDARQAVDDVVAYLTGDPTPIIELADTTAVSVVRLAVYVMVVPGTSMATERPECDQELQNACDVVDHVQQRPNARLDPPEVPDDIQVMNHCYTEFATSSRIAVSKPALSNKIHAEGHYSIDGLTNWSGVYERPDGNVAACPAPAGQASLEVEFRATTSWNIPGFSQNQFLDRQSGSGWITEARHMMWLHVGTEADVDAVDPGLNLWPPKLGVESYFYARYHTHMRWSAAIPAPYRMRPFYYDHCKMDMPFETEGGQCSPDGWDVTTA